MEIRGNPNIKEGGKKAGSLKRREIVRNIPARTQSAVAARELDRFARSGHALFSGMKAITGDNGCAFLNIGTIEKPAIRTGRRSFHTPSEPPSYGYIDRTGAFVEGPNKNWRNLKKPERKRHYQ